MATRNPAGRGTQSDAAEGSGAAEKTTSAFVEWAQTARSWMHGISELVARSTTTSKGRWMLDVIKLLPEAPQWLNIMPPELVDALCQHHIVLHPELTLPDVGDVLAAYRTAGADAACARMLKLQAALFAGGQSRARIITRWRISKRWKVLSHVLTAHDHRLYAVSVPAALAQAEGIVGDLVSHVGIVTGDDLEDYVRALADADELRTALTKSFVTTLLGHFGRGRHALGFSRHAILHGSDCDYGTLENSARALSWVDLLIIVGQKRAVARGSTRA